MATMTQIVVGRVGDNLTSEASSVSAEPFTSVYDVPVKLANKHLVNGSVVVDNPENGNFVENTDYTINYLNGSITVLSTGGMDDETEYAIDYDWNVPNLAFKINEVTNTAASVLWVSTCRAGQNGVATIIYTT